MITGKVWLVGAGPGDLGLFTLKGLEILQNAEVVVYDSLVGQSILTQIPDQAKLIYVGKRASNHTMRQENINQVLVDEAKKGYRVVRLKGGDPFLFGRGGEELELLKKNNVPFEVVPGVTSSLAVPAYNGIPVTHRDFCSSVHIITGHKREGQDYDIDFHALVHTKGTLVFLMGVSALPSIMSGLLEAGMDKDMPAAILQKGTTAGQKRIVATISTLEQRVREEGIETPAIIVVGKVCQLSQDFEWYEKLPLAGWKVLVTRPKKLISQTASLLRQKGAEVLELPAIRTEPMEDQSALVKAFDEMYSFTWLVFTSPTGVDVFFDEMKKNHKDIRMLGQIKIASIGQGTAKKLAANGLQPDFVPSVYDGDHLGEELAKMTGPADRILIPRAEIGNQVLVECLEHSGAKVEDVPTYRTIYAKSEVFDEKTCFENNEIDCVIFTSASTVKGFVEATKGIDYSKVTAACIGKQTKAAADQYNMKTFMSEKATIESLIELVEKMKGGQVSWN
ncbi:MAG: uroporphyrinogen-III C-methyltransferase [Eubacteriales bacterium]|nr:uroporphyrinogen-III C-methyltransferase [Eubacteriales bacterium]